MLACANPPRWHFPYLRFRHPQMASGIQRTPSATTSADNDGLLSKRRIISLFALQQIESRSWMVERHLRRFRLPLLMTFLGNVRKRPAIAIQIGLLTTQGLPPAHHYVHILGVQLHAITDPLRQLRRG